MACECGLTTRCYRAGRCPRRNRLQVG
jgi:hypothetical protein